MKIKILLAVLFLVSSFSNATIVKQQDNVITYYDLIHVNTETYDNTTQVCSATTIVREQQGNVIIYHDLFHMCTAAYNNTTGKYCASFDGWTARADRAEELFKKLRIQYSRQQIEQLVIV